jgi:hypothetical protein
MHQQFEAYREASREAVLFPTRSIREAYREAVLFPSQRREAVLFPTQLGCEAPRLRQHQRRLPPVAHGDTVTGVTSGSDGCVTGQ